MNVLLRLLREDGALLGLLLFLAAFFLVAVVAVECAVTMAAPAEDPAWKINRRDVRTWTPPDQSDVRCYDLPSYGSYGTWTCVVIPPPPVCCQEVK